MSLLSIWINASLFAICFAAVFSPRVKDGVVVKIGLCLAGCGFFAIAASGGMCHEEAQLAVSCGAAVVASGVALRVLRSHRIGRAAPHRRASDWVALDEGGGGKEAS